MTRPRPITTRRRRPRRDDDRRYDDVTHEQLDADEAIDRAMLDSVMEMNAARARARTHPDMLQKSLLPLELRRRQLDDDEEV